MYRIKGTPAFNLLMDGITITAVNFDTIAGHKIEEGTEYEFTVPARNAIGWSETSDVLSVLAVKTEVQSAKIVVPDEKPEPGPITEVSA